MCYPRETPQEVIDQIVTNEIVYERLCPDEYALGVKRCTDLRKKAQADKLKAFRNPAKSNVPSITNPS